ncbi:MAG: hypothetical protein ACI4QN_03460 [Candidatus Coproplasma sp.]
MKEKISLIKNSQIEDTTALTEEDLKEFMAATSLEEQWQTLLAHAEKNNKIIKIRRLKKMEQFNDHNYEEISRQFEEFCHTKGIVAKFKVAFSDMAENARKQRERDKADFEEVKRQSAQANPEFTELLHTKGFKAKVKLIVENIKKSAKEAPRRTAAAVDEMSAQTKANIAKAQAGLHCPSVSCGLKVEDVAEYSADELSREFNEFLKAKGLDTKYAVEITDTDGE